MEYVRRPGKVVQVLLTGNDVHAGLSGPVAFHPHRAAPDGREVHLNFSASHLTRAGQTRPGRTIAPAGSSATQIFLRKEERTARSGTGDLPDPTGARLLGEGRSLLRRRAEAVVQAAPEIYHALLFNFARQRISDGKLPGKQVRNRLLQTQSLLGMAEGLDSIASKGLWPWGGEFPETLHE